MSYYDKMLQILLNFNADGTRRVIANHFTIVLDWDDTVNDTYLEMRAENKRLGGPDIAPGVYLTTANTNGVLDKILAESRFMSVYHPRSGSELLKEFVEWAQTHGIRIAICTHRGFHANAAELSKAAFEATGWTADDIHIIDPAVDGDKVEYLNAQYPQGYVLVDDRPRWDDHSALPDNVYLMDQPWNQSIVTATPEHRVSNLFDLVMRLKQVYKNWVDGYLMADNEMANCAADALIYAYLMGYIPKRIDEEWVKGLAKAGSQFRYLGQLFPVLYHRPDWTTELPPSYDPELTDREFVLRIASWIERFPIVPIRAADLSEWRESFNMPGRETGRRDASLTRVEGLLGYEYTRRYSVLVPNSTFTSWTHEDAKYSHRVVEPNEDGLFISPVTPPCVYQINDKLHTSADDAIATMDSIRGELWTAIINGDTEHAIAKRYLNELWVVDYLSVALNLFGSKVSNEITIMVLDTMRSIDIELKEQPELFWADVVLENAGRLKHYFGVIGGEFEYAIAQYAKTRVLPAVEEKPIKHFVNFEDGKYIVNSEMGYHAAAIEWYDNTYPSARLGDRTIEEVMELAPFTGPSIATFIHIEHRKPMVVLTPIANIANAIKFSV